MRHANLAAALAAFQAERPSLTATATATIPPKEGKSGYRYDYATLADVEQAVLPLLGRHGLAWHCKTTVGDRGMLLVCALMHESGEALESIFPLPNPGNPQAFGSLLTYFKRYALMMATGVSAGGDDDDGAAAQVASGHRSDREDARRAQDRPDPAAGTRAGAADGYAWALTSEPLDVLPEIWRHVEAGGFTGDKPSKARAEQIREHYRAEEIPLDSEPGRQGSMATGNLAQIAAYRLIVAGWKAASLHALGLAVQADKTYMALAQQQANFGRFTLSAAAGGQRMGDWLATTAAALHRDANSDPEQNDAPPWAVSADPPEGRQETVVDIGTVDDSDDASETPWYERDTIVDEGRPAVLEGQE